ncbi:MAG: hypothetical protein ACI9G1_005815, partial [Pirellulaceae bacterium]
MRIRYRITAVAFAIAMFSNVFGSTAWSQNQNRNPNQPPREKFRKSATIHAVGPGFLQVKGEKGEQWLVKVPENPLAIQFQASGSAELLQPGMFIRFTNEFDKRGIPQNAVTKLTVFTPREGYEIGVFPNAGLGNEALFADVGEVKKPKVETSSFLVAGQLTALRKGTFTVKAGNVQIKGELADTAQLSFDISDYSLSRPGDS